MKNLFLLPSVIIPVVFGFTVQLKELTHSYFEGAINTEDIIDFVFYLPISLSAAALRYYEDDREEFYTPKFCPGRDLNYKTKDTI